MLMRTHCLAVEGTHVIDRRRQTDAFDDRRRACLEPCRRIGIGDDVARDFADHLAAAIERPHRLQMRALAIERADTRRPIKLVAGDRIEIDIQRLHVHDLMHRALASIRQHRHAFGVRPRHNLFQRRHRAQHVRHMRDRNQLGLRPDGGIQCLDIQRTVIAQIDPTQHRALPLAQEMPRHDVGVMLHHRQHDLVVRLNAGREEGIGDEIDRLGAALGENDLVFMFGVQKLLHCAARRFVTVRRLGGEIMHPAMHIRVFAAREIAHRVQNLLRLLRRGRAIQINQRLAVHRLGENLEIGAGRQRIEAGLDGFGDRRHDNPPSAASTACHTEARTVSFSIWSTASPIKARINSARASVSGMPRERR